MAGDCFLKIDGIPGESTDDKHKDWIEVMSYSSGVSQMAGGDRSTGGAATQGRCDHQDISIVKALDKASPTLNLFAAKASTSRTWLSNFAAQQVTRRNIWNIKWRM